MRKLDAVSQREWRHSTVSSAKINKPRNTGHVWAITRWSWWWQLVIVAWYGDREDAAMSCTSLCCQAHKFCLFSNAAGNDDLNEEKSCHHGAAIIATWGYQMCDVKLVVISTITMKWEHFLCIHYNLEQNLIWFFFPPLYNLNIYTRTCTYTYISFFWIKIVTSKDWLFNLLLLSLKSA